jgi:hypothetical protein
VHGLGAQIEQIYRDGEPVASEEKFPGLRNFDGVGDDTEGQSKA